MICNWIIINFIEYEVLIELGKKLEGGVDVLFDVFYLVFDLGLLFNVCWMKVFYLFMVGFLVVCLDILWRVMVRESIKGSLGFLKKMLYMDSFRKGFNLIKGFEVCVFFYIEFMSVGMVLSL